MKSIAIYIQGKYAKKAYKVESYNVRAWPGLELIKDVLVRGGYDIKYCGSATVTEHKIILVSITHSIDWYPFIEERVKWRAGDYTIIAGGTGIHNIRAVLPQADIFVFGRAEDIIIPLVEAALSDKQYNHPSVAYSVDFKADKTYRIAQARGLYPHPVKMANEIDYVEKSIGCQRACLFCSYCWHRKHIGGLQHESGAMDVMHKTSAEITFFDLKLDEDNIWGDKDGAGHRIVGLDGLSERLRFMVNKPIKNKAVKKFIEKAF